MLTNLFYYLLRWWLNHHGPNIKNKKVMLYGPFQCGKTTFINWRLFNKFTEEYHASADDGYKKDPDHNIEYYDLGGRDAFYNNGQFEDHYKSNDIIIVMFDAYKYRHEKNYPIRVNAIFDAMNKLGGKYPGKQLLIVATHKDQLNGDVPKSLHEWLDSNKDYYTFIIKQPFVCCDLREKEGVKDVLELIKDNVK